MRYCVPENRTDRCEDLWKDGWTKNPKTQCLSPQRDNKPTLSSYWLADLMVPRHQVLSLTLFTLAQLLLRFFFGCEKLNMNQTSRNKSKHAHMDLTDFLDRKDFAKCCNKYNGKYLLLCCSEAMASVFFYHLCSRKGNIQKSTAENNKIK